MPRRTAPPRIVVVGSGLAGYGVLRELRKLAPNAELVLITGDDGHFYSKPALSTALAKGKTPDALVTTTGAKMAAQLKLDLRVGRFVEAIHPEGQALLTTGGPVFYDKLVLAMGALPIRPVIEGNAAHRAVCVNHLDDYRAFREALPPAARVLVIGAGLVGSEFANDLSATGHTPIVVDILAHPLAQLVPIQVGDALHAAMAQAGVQWHFGRKVVALDREGTATRATLDDGSTVLVDVVLSAVGLRPNIEVAAQAGLVVGRGIKVDETGRTSDVNIYAIGDCAEYPHGLSAYVTPIMTAARAIAASVLGAPAVMRFPALSVQVKTTAYPIVLLPAPSGRAGRWAEAEPGGPGLKYLFQDESGRVLGYVLTQARCEERIELDRAIGAGEWERQAA